MHSFTPLRGVVLYALAIAGAASGQTPRALTLEDYFRVETASSPAMSPDGKWVAVVRGYIDRAANERRSEIWLAPADASAPATRLTQPAFNSSNPVWSPDGKLLAFTSRRPVPEAEGDQSTVWFIAMDRPGEAFQIPGVESTPVFSPDNRWIAVTIATAVPRSSAAPAAAVTPFERELAQRFKGRIYDWMNYRFDGRGYLPDPRHPAATPPEELYLVPREGGTPRQLTRLGVNVRDVAWRPDSRALVFTANAHQRDEYTYERADLWLVDLEGQVRRLTDDGYHHTGPAWTPDGQSIVFRRQMGLSMVIAASWNHGAPVDLYRMRTAGGPMENLTASWDLLPGEPALSADGRYVYFSGGIGGDAHLFRVALSGGAVEQVTRGARRLGGFSFSTSFDQMSYTLTDPTHPSEVYAARIDGSAERKLTGFSDPLLAEVGLEPAERLVYRSKDGTEIEGWVIRPRATQPESRAPLIVSIHGGPHSAYGNDFSFQFQLWAAQGHGVLYTNPRGSTGYGEKFLWATWGGWGNRDGEDVLAGVDEALRRYPFDPARLGVSGYSYGGFLTNWLITQTPRFAAAVSGAGISNWVSDYGTADIPRTKESEFFGPPWEPRSAELLLKQSPIMHAEGVKTPTLFVHGETDFRVPIEQAEQMYLALKKQRVEAKFVRYPDTYHGGWTPWNTVHRYHQELAWWERFLKTGRETASSQPSR